MRPPPPHQVERRRDSGPVYVRRRGLADLLTIAPRLPEPDPNLLHDLVDVGLRQAVPPGDAPDHAGKPADHRLERGRNRVGCRSRVHGQSYWGQEGWRGRIKPRISIAAFRPLIPTMLPPRVGTDAVLTVLA